MPPLAHPSNTIDIVLTPIELILGYKGITRIRYGNDLKLHACMLSQPTSPMSSQHTSKECIDNHILINATLK